MTEAGGPTWEEDPAGRIVVVVELTLLLLLLVLLLLQAVKPNIAANMMIYNAFISFDIKKN